MRYDPKSPIISGHDRAHSDLLGKRGENLDPCQACDVVLRARRADENLNFRGPDLIVVVLDESTRVEELS